MQKVEGKTNGYIIDDATTNEEWLSVCKHYPKVKCVICNIRTASYFKIPFMGRSIFTINNKLPDNTVYINKIC